MKFDYHLVEERTPSQCGIHRRDPRVAQRKPCEIRFNGAVLDFLQHST